ncbi:DEKNAAC100811 [Brettanomyces naardenensis]|uniref:DEKNAAC100811 n=1 Tax=Brettanomyces naardenensis TaxID=13370 RepID=A0A448YFE8_BRENA|nr:DEKNAAC100811 [Brettanomyces naardenensis]
MEIDSISLQSVENGTRFDKMVEAPFDYLIDHTSGKNLRGMIIQTFNLIYKVPTSELKTLEEIVNILHVSSLIIDDVEDNSKMRRGKPCAHQIFGNPQSINCANYMYFKAMRLTAKLFGDDAAELKNKAISIFIEEMLNLHHGQGLDLYWRDNFVCPSESEYVQMVMNKTGGLFRLSTRLMGLVSGFYCPELIELSNLLGILYQVKDDYLNLQSEAYQGKKGYCEDISEGKFSFPVIHAVLKYGVGKGSQPEGEGQELLSILKLRTQDPILKRHCLELIECAGSLDYSKQTIHNLEIKARELINRIIDRYDDDPKHQKAFLMALSQLAMM